MEILQNLMPEGPAELGYDGIVVHSLNGILSSPQSSFISRGL